MSEQRWFRTRDVGGRDVLMRVNGSSGVEYLHWSHAGDVPQDADPLDEIAAALNAAERRDAERKLLEDLLRESLGCLSLVDEDCQDEENMAAINALMPRINAALQTEGNDG